MIQIYRTLLYNDASRYFHGVLHAGTHAWDLDISMSKIVGSLEILAWIKIFENICIRYFLLWKYKVTEMLMIYDDSY